MSRFFSHVFADELARQSSSAAPHRSGVERRLCGELPKQHSDATVESFGLRREPTRILNAVDAAFAALLIAVIAAHAVVGAGLTVHSPGVAGRPGGWLLALATSACVAWLLVRLPAWRTARQDRW